MTEAVWDESGLATHYMADILDIEMDPREGGFIFFDHGQMVGAVRVYDDRGGPENRMASIMGASTSPRWFTRATIKAVASMIFNDPPYGMGLKRLNSFINISNKRSIEITERIGFKREGLMRQAGPDREDVVVLGMVKEECPWLTPQKDDEATPSADNPANTEPMEADDGVEDAAQRA
jgi:RimJ/RimL family protein N-acetyltransferase